MSKETTQLDYEKRLNRVIDYLYQNLEKDIRFEDLAEIACLSSWHWHRIFVAMRGETIAATIRRLRLGLAAERLANSEMALEEIAQRACYGSTDAFGRAFKEAYQQSPANYREAGSHNTFKAAIAAKDSAGFPVSIETIPQTRCASIAHRGDYMHIDRAFGQLFAALSQQSIAMQEAPMLGIFYDDPDFGPVEELRSKACLPVEEKAVLAAPLEEVTLRGGTYARLHYKGPYADMRGAYRWFLGVWLPQSGYELDDAPIFEAYLNNPQQVVPTELKTHIHLPLKTA